MTICMTQILQKLGFTLKSHAWWVALSHLKEEEKRKGGGGGWWLGWWEDFQDLALVVTVQIH